MRSAQVLLLCIGSFLASATVSGVVTITITQTSVYTGSTIDIDFSPAGSSAYTSESFSIPPSQYLFFNAANTSYDIDGFSINGISVDLDFTTNAMTALNAINFSRSGTSPTYTLASIVGSATISGDSAARLNTIFSRENPAERVISNGDVTVYYGTPDANTSVTVTFVPIPEPSHGAALAAVFALAVLGYRRRARA